MEGTMRKAIIINSLEKKQVFFTDGIEDSQIFEFVRYIEKTLHQSNLNQLTDEELITFAKEKLKVYLEPTKLVAEININKP